MSPRFSTGTMIRVLVRATVKRVAPIAAASVAFAACNAIIGIQDVPAPPTGDGSASDGSASGGSSGGNGSSSGSSGSSAGSGSGALSDSGLQDAPDGSSSSGGSGSASGSTSGGSSGSIAGGSSGDAGAADADDSGAPIDAGDTVPPTVPTGLTTTGATDASISLSWTASTDNVGVTGYKIFRNGAQVGTSLTPGYTDSGLAASTMYTYTVSAYDAVGNDSAQSAQLIVSTTASPDTTPPSVPTGLTTTGASDSSVSLSWTASTDNVAVTGYKIFRGGAQVGTSPTASYTDSGLTASTMYSYTVSAYDAANNNSAQSAALVVSTNTTVDTTPPSVPTGLMQTASTSTSISLGWTASTDDVGVTGYTIFRAGTQVGTSATTMYTDTGLTDSTSYSYTVSAYDAAMNNSAPSTALSAMTSACSISVTTKTFSSSCDGHITYTNTGTGTETNPTLKFTLPSSEGSLDVSGSQCKVSGGLQTVPSSITAMTCSSSGTTYTYAFTGTLDKGAQISIYFTTNGACSTTVPTDILVAATSCP